MRAARLEFGQGSNNAFHPMMATKILILGGYGNFGKRITESLANQADIEIIIAGRSQEKPIGYVLS
jgi:short subunit dehydrogenase-like uncharacterized protein